MGGEIFIDEYEVDDVDDDEQYSGITATVLKQHWLAQVHAS